MEIYNDIIQGTPEWFDVRAGIPTSSEFSTAMSKGRGKEPSKTRKTYMLKLLGERMTGEPMESFSNSHMERGKEIEEEARLAYEFRADVVCEQVGFIKNHNAGSSPDSLIGDNGLLEIKTKLPHLHLQVLENARVPSEHEKQVQGQLWISEREWCDFVCYWPKMPLFVMRVVRDEKMIGEVAEAVRIFNDELDELEEKIRRQYL